MEEDIYVNVERATKPVDPRPSTNQTGSNGSKRFHGAVVLCLGLLSVCLLAGLVGLAIQSAEVSAHKDKLTERLQASDDAFSSVTEERDLLNASLVNMTQERDLLNARLINMTIEVNRLTAEVSALKDKLTERLQASDDAFSSVTEERDLLNASLVNMTQGRDLLNARLINMTIEVNRLKPCPAGWMKFIPSCYVLSEKSDSWENGRKDCRSMGADLVVIDSAEEQNFLNIFTKEMAWIGLTDIIEEGTWKWINGAPLSLQYWREAQPDNGGGIRAYGEEDCAHIQIWEGSNKWNDRSCNTHMRWICEKMI